MNEPYQAPSADLSVGETETYKPKFLSFSGRIGRMRYFVYGCSATFLFYLVFGIATALFIPVFAAGEAFGALGVVLGLVGFAAFLAMLVLAWGYAVRRLNDVNASGWLSLLFLIPLVNLILGLVLLFMKGTNGSNDYGAAPAENNGSLKIGFWVLLVLVIVYIGLAVPAAIEEYNKYVDAAAQIQGS